MRCSALPGWSPARLLTCLGPSSALTQDEGCDYLFTEKIVRTVDYAHCSLVAFQVFEEYFLLVNKRAKKIESKGESEFTVLEFPLVGMEALWRIALETSKADVVKKVTVLRRCVAFALWLTLCVFVRRASCSSTSCTSVSRPPSRVSAGWPAVCRVK